MVVLWIVSALWALIFGAFLMDGGTSGAGVVGKLVMFLMAFGPVGFLTWFLFHRASRRESAHAAMLADAGVQPSTGLDYSKGGTGIAINKEARTLSLLSGGFWKTYPFSDVREWETRKERAGQVIGGGLVGVAMAHGNDRRAAANTGLFVVVRDVDYPKWRIEMSDESTQARWMEILRQQLNER